MPTKIVANFGGEIPFVTPRGMDGRRIIKVTERYLTMNGAETVKNSIIPADAVLMSCIGSDMGKAAIAGKTCITNQQINSIVINKDHCAKYVYYNLSLRQNEIRGMASGSAVPILNKNDFAKIPITLPSLLEQRAISHILGTLDDMIELNRQMNETLEAMARALFKSWFVDFDPVRAKIEGRDPGLPPDIANLFPDSFEESELGLIPKGWKVLPLSTIISIIGGGTPKTNVSEYWDGDIPWFSLTDAPNEGNVFVIDTEKHITQSGLENSSTKILREGTTIISARGTVGKCALVGKLMAMNQSCYGIQAKHEHGDYFIYFNIRNQIGNLQKAGHGSVFNTITRETFNYIKIANPSNKLTKAFDESIRSLMLQVVNNLNECNFLSKIQDELLPKLISGEIRVPDAEKFIKENLE